MKGVPDSGIESRQSNRGRTFAEARATSAVTTAWCFRFEAGSRLNGIGSVPTRLAG